MSRPPRGRRAKKTGTIEDFTAWKLKTARMVRNTTSDSPLHIARCADAADVIEAARDVGDVVDSGVWMPFFLCEEIGVPYVRWR